MKINLLILICVLTFDLYSQPNNSIVNSNNMTQSFRALLDTEISELKILKSLTKGQLLADQPVSQGPSYIFCTKYNIHFTRFSYGNPINFFTSCGKGTNGIIGTVLSI